MTTPRNIKLAVSAASNGPEIKGAVLPSVGLAVEAVAPKLETEMLTTTDVVVELVGEAV